MSTMRRKEAGCPATSAHPAVPMTRGCGGLFAAKFERIDEDEFWRNNNASE